MTWLYLVAFLAIISAVMFGTAAAAAIYLGLRWCWRKFRDWRTDRMIRCGIKYAARHGWLPEDIQ